MDNVYQDCPPSLMNDGRMFTDYRPQCTSEHLIQLQNGITNSYDYRMWLQAKASEIMNFNRAYTIKKNGCEPCDARQVVWSNMAPLAPKTPYDN